MSQANTFKRQKLRVGDEIEGFRLTEQLGEGGMGEVWRAYHALTQRPVALKILLTKFRNGMREHADTLARKEVVALCRVRHPNIVEVHHAGILADGRVWMALELVRGRTLRSFLANEAPLPVALALYLMVEIADGIAAVHELGIIHRDMKPENVMITAQKQVKVLDFGAAKVEETGLEGTVPGRRFGTIAYMSPEQVWGDPATLASDVYALGVVLDEMLRGRHMWAANGDIGTLLPLQELGAAHVFQFPPPIREERPEVPAYVTEVVERALMKRQEDRYPNAKVFAAALRKAEVQYRQDIAEGRFSSPQSLDVLGPGRRRMVVPPTLVPEATTTPAMASRSVVVRLPEGPDAGRVPRKPVPAHAAMRTMRMAAVGGGALGTLPLSSSTKPLGPQEVARRDAMLQGIELLATSEAPAAVDAIAARLDAPYPEVQQAAARALQGRSKRRHDPAGQPSQRDVATQVSRGRAAEKKSPRTEGTGEPEKAQRGAKVPHATIGAIAVAFMFIGCALGWVVFTLLPDTPPMAPERAISSSSAAPEAPAVPTAPSTQPETPAAPATPPPLPPPPPPKPSAKPAKKPVPTASAKPKPIVPPDPF